MYLRKRYIHLRHYLNRKGVAKTDNNILFNDTDGGAPNAERAGPFTIDNASGNTAGVSSATLSDNAASIIKTSWPRSNSGQDFRTANLLPYILVYLWT